MTHETVKHVTVKVRFLQECVLNKIVLLVYIKTCKNLADIMTKQSTGLQFRQYRDYALGYIDAIVVAHAGIILRRHQRVRVRV